MEKAFGKFIQEEALLGFDTETRPSFKRGENHPVALLQLARKPMLFYSNSVIWGCPIP
ncbi:MAG: hypothetical protein Ct9H90mP8_1920 [Pseudomonadota bacterium]|nr:MAG: hypothetical protein Ct9H90mP8_1920 [Pseudomonadota bacterium]